MMEEAKTYRTRAEAVEAGMRMAAALELGHSIYETPYKKPTAESTTHEVYREVTVMRHNRRYYPVLVTNDPYRLGNRLEVRTEDGRCRTESMIRESVAVGKITDNPTKPRRNVWDA